MVEDRLDAVNKSAEKILRDLKYYWERENEADAEICYWQLHGILHTLDLLGLYDPVTHKPIERECESFLMYLYDRILARSVNHESREQDGCSQ